MWFGNFVERCDFTRENLQYQIAITSGNQQQVFIVITPL
jgi:hypothetical protein